ncbi:amidase family protein [Phytoactinopolyspora limicola]|uniref:amidase family protein n=1 Tax=Phytoactinopolyspora limicola TaxID=2715536 RepID=UPI001409745C|nr:amidase family protein [Phytoactinopolyspora limicola]
MTGARGAPPSLHPAEGSALWLGREIAAGRLDPVVLADECLAKAADAAAEHVFISLTSSRARLEAAATVRRVQRSAPAGPLDGVPIAWKDLVDIRGIRTTAGSATTRNMAEADADADVVRNAAAAGLITIGKTNLSEFAFSGLGTNQHFGTPIHPLVPGRVPGGSSSGSAVAVAVGVVPGAVGTDTSGSVRVPASFCGLVGFRPTHGRVSLAGVTPLAPTLDTVGPITRTVLDAITLDAVLAGDAVPVGRTQPPEPGDLVVPRGPLIDHLDAPVADQFGLMLDELRRDGWTIRTVRIPEFDDVARLFEEVGTLVAAEAYRTRASAVHGPDAALIDPPIRSRLLAGRTVLENHHRTLLARRTELRRHVRERLGHTLLVYPTVPVTAPHVAAVESDPEVFADTNRRVLRNTMITSFVDLPSLTLPAGATSDGVPFGLSLSGAPGTDQRVLWTSAAVEPTLRSPARSPFAPPLSEGKGRAADEGRAR